MPGISEQTQGHEEGVAELCVTCAHEDDCVHREGQDSPVLQCELFEEAQVKRDHVAAIVDKHMHRHGGMISVLEALQAKYRRLFEALPAPSPGTVKCASSDSTVGPVAGTLMSRASRKTFSSGDSSEPGSGAKIAVRQVLAVIQAVCDANFFNAVNSDENPDGSNSSNNFFPPVYSTPERNQNSRLLVLDQDTLEVIDEYSAPNDPRWTCMAGIAFSDEGMFVSMFHGAAVFVIDWKAGIDNEKSEGVGSNSPNGFKLGRKQNRAKVIRVIDMLGNGADPWDANRRDSLRAITFDEGGNLYATNRARSEECHEGEIGANGCNPGVFRQHISIVSLGEDYPTATLALDPGVNVIAGIRTNRMSGPGCDAINPPDENGDREFPDICDVETLLVGASAMNPGCENTGPIGANPCFTPGGYVAEYLIDEAHLDGANGSCTGDPADGFGSGEGNEGCAQPIATFFGAANDEDKVDPRMLMVIHESFVQ